MIDEETSRIIREAKTIAEQAHAGVKRKWIEELYIEHPKRVAYEMAAYCMENKDWPRYTIAAAWLHDVLEDTNFSRDEIIQRCGLKTYYLVLELTNPSKGLKRPRAERKELDRMHLRNASLEARVLKLIDRLDNLQDLQRAEPDFQALYLDETEQLLSCLQFTSGLEALHQRFWLPLLERVAARKKGLADESKR